MTTSAILHELGLSQYEASIYLALLEIGTGTVTEIAEKARVKRPTAYLVLGELLQKGFVSLVPHPKKLVYTSSGPDALLSYANERRRHLLDIMPHLESLHAQSKDKPRVRFFDGVKSVSSYYQTIAYPNDEIDFFASISSVMAHPDIPLIHELPGYKKKKIREILTQSKEDLEYARALAPFEDHHKIKVLPKNSEWVFKTDSILTPGKVGITSLTKKVFVVLIEDADVYASFRALFNLAWQAAVPVQKYLR